jgi:hypothetical protein
MMEKFAQPGEGGGCTPIPFHSTVSTNKYKGVVYTPAERTDILPLYLLYPYMYSVWPTQAEIYYINLMLFLSAPNSLGENQRSQ